MTGEAMITDELLDEILALESKAAEGPWVARPNADGNGIEISMPPTEGTTTADAKLIVAMRNNIRAICEELKRKDEQRRPLTVSPINNALTGHEDTTRRDNATKSDTKGNPPSRGT